MALLLSLRLCVQDLVSSIYVAVFLRWTGACRAGPNLGSAYVML
jgi:hypothetical protein